jgi:Domain of unknown function (DUF4359)
MTLLRLSILVIVLSLSVGLAFTNPTKDDYLDFVETELGKAMDRSALNQPTRDSAMVRSIFRSHSHELVRSFVGPRTIRRNWGLVSFYESRLSDADILVLGVGGRFVPLRGIDASILRLGRMAF